MDARRGAGLLQRAVGLLRADPARGCCCRAPGLGDVQQRLRGDPGWAVDAAAVKHQHVDHHGSPGARAAAQAGAAGVHQGGDRQSGAARGRGRHLLCRRAEAAETTSTWWPTSRRCSRSRSSPRCSASRPANASRSGCGPTGSCTARRTTRFATESGVADSFAMDEYFLELSKREAPPARRPDHQQAGRPRPTRTRPG